MSHFVRGHLAGAFSSSNRREMRCEETHCIAAGDPYCEFVIKASEE